MKKNNIILTASLLLITIGCSKSYFDININPNTASSSTPELILPTALVNSASPILATNTGAATGTNFISAWMGYWAPSGSYAQAPGDAASYVQNSGTGYGTWNGRYDNLEDYQYTIDQAKAQNKPFYQGAGIIMQAFVFHQLVDQFNNIPYSAALKGTTNIQPVYDDAKAIYESLSTNLGTAAAIMQRPDAVGSAASDILFGGNALRWVQFANTLRLRLLIHQTQMAGRGAYIQGEINKILANGAGFLTEDAGVNPGYAANPNQQNPFWSMNYNTAGTYTNDFWRANKYPIAFCIANNDPRYKYWYAPIAGGSYVGNQLGGLNAVGSLSSTFGPGVLKSVSQPAIIMSAAESYFLQAEAGLKGYISNSPAALFNSGVAASFSYLGAPLGSYTSQAGNKNTNYAACSSDAERLACIIRQKYLAFNTVTPMEAWSDYRRLGLPSDVPITQSTFVDVPAIPLRLLYPTVEYNNNATNVGLQGTINPHTSKIFWMP
jgi:Starch-binding associating with outer membrane